MAISSKKETQAIKDIEEALKAPRSAHKIRITTMIDGDVLDAVKAEAKKQEVPYQTLLNQSLRETFLSDKKEVPDANKAELMKEISKAMDKLLIIKKPVEKKKKKAKRLPQKERERKRA